MKVQVASGNGREIHGGSSVLEAGASSGPVVVGVSGSRNGTICHAVGYTNKDAKSFVYSSLWQKKGRPERIRAALRARGPGRGYLSSVTVFVATCPCASSRTR